MVNDMVLPSGVLEPAALSPQEIWAVAVHRRSGFPQDVTVAHAGKSRAVMHMRTPYWGVVAHSSDAFMHVAIHKAARVACRLLPTGALSPAAKARLAR